MSMFNYFSDFYWQNSVNGKQWTIYSSIVQWYIEKYGLDRFIMEQKQINDKDLKMFLSDSRIPQELAESLLSIKSLRTLDIVLISQSSLSMPNQKVLSIPNKKESYTVKPRTKFFLLEIKTDNSIQHYKIPAVSHINNQTICQIKVKNEGILLGTKLEANYLHQIIIPFNNPSNICFCGNSDFSLEVENYFHYPKLLSLKNYKDFPATT